MRRALIVVVAIAAIAAAIWWWRRGTTAHPSSARDDATTKVSSPHTVEPALPTDADATSPPPSTDDAGRAAPPVEPQLNPPTVQARMAEVHARLQEILHPCLTTVSSAHPPPDAEFRFSFRLTFASNQATLSDVRLVWSEVNSHELETCFLQKVTSAHWAQEEPDGSTTVEEAFRMMDLKDVK